MRCVIPGPKLKVFARALHSLAKIGEDLYVDAQDDCVSLRSVNSARSAFVSYSFHRDFFDEFDAARDEEAEEDESESKCRLCMKAVIVAFRSINQLDKNVETCVMNFMESDYKLRIQFYCRFGVTKTYVLPFIESEPLKPNYDVEKLKNRFTAQSKVLTEAVLNFLTNQEEVTMTVNPTKFLMKNFVEDDEQITVRTELSMQPGEFEEFTIDRNVSVTYCLKELRSIIGFADAVSMPISACFNVGGEPIIFSLKCPGSFEGTLVMATLSEEPVRHDYGRRSHSTPLNQSQQLSEASVPISDIRAPTASNKRPFEDELTTPGSSQAPSTDLDSPVIRRNAVRFKNRDDTMDIDETVGVDFRNVGRESHAGPGANGDNRESTSRARGSPHEVAPPRTSKVTPSTSKKARYIFQRCFDTTFNPTCVPGTDKILAPDSDEESDERDNATVISRRINR